MSNAVEMDAQEIINYIATAPKKTPVKLYVREKPGMKVAWGNAHVYGGRRGKTVFGDWDELKAILDANADSIDYYDVENDCRNSAVPMLDLKGINARIEPGAIIRDEVEIGEGAVIMMGAILNIGTAVGEGTMIDMGAVLGGRAIVGRHSHIGAGTVLVRACPMTLAQEDVSSLVQELAGYLLANRRELIPEKLDWLFHNVACRAAIKGGDQTSTYELERFVEKLLLQDEIRYCPHGRPVMVVMSQAELEKQFGRMQ